MFDDDDDDCSDAYDDIDDNDKQQGLLFFFSHPSLGDIMTGMVRRESDRSLYYHNASCTLVDNSTWSWATAKDALWDPDHLCVSASDQSFQWRQRECNDNGVFVCELYGTCQRSLGGRRR